MIKTKRCSKCKKNKSIDSFHKNKNSNDGYHHYCNKCKNDDNRLRYKNSGEYRNKMKNSALIRKYNLSYNDLIKKFNSQNCKCKICGKILSLDKRNTCIDHNHSTGKVRDILCSRCNNLVGLSDENINLLLNVIDYIKLHNK